MCTDHNHDEATDKQGAAQGHNDSHTHHHNHNAAKPNQDPSDLAECPVMPGNMVVKSEAESDGMYRDHNGTRYHLCCDTCVALFDANPAEYVNAA